MGSLRMTATRPAGSASPRHRIRFLRSALGWVVRSLVAVLAAVTSACAVLPGATADRTSAREATAEILSIVHAPLNVRHVDRVAADTEVVGALQALDAVHEDTLADLARRHDLGYQEMRDANPEVDPWLPGAGTRIYLPTLMILPAAPRDGIVINLPGMRLFDYAQASSDAAGAQHLFTHPIGIGREGWATPTGTMRVTHKTRDPKWYPPASVRAEHAAEGDPLPEVVLPGPDNPLGRFKIRLSRPNYLIHGTNKPAGVGMRVSHGCIRLYPEDIAPLFERVALETPVHIVDQPVLAGWLDGELYLEVHPPLAEDPRDLEQLAWQAIDDAMARRARPGVTPDAGLIAQLVRARRGIPVPVTRHGLSLSAYLAAARLVANDGARRRGEVTASR